MGAVTSIGKVQKLKIEAYKKASFRKSDLIPGYTFVGDFNPSDYTLTRTNRVSAQPTNGTSRPETTFAHGCNDTLRISFTFDGTGVAGRVQSVMLKVNLFLGLMQYRGDIHKPPYVKLMWGDFVFQGVIASATAKFTLFNRNGRPIRAKVDAEFTEAVSEDDRLDEEQTSSPDVNRVWVVRQGDRLDQIAFESYGDTRYWAHLAEANALANPRCLKPGDMLRLPRLQH